MAPPPSLAARCLVQTARYGAPMTASEERVTDSASRSNVVPGCDGNVPHVAYQRMQQDYDQSDAFQYILAKDQMVERVALKKVSIRCNNGGGAALRPHRMTTTNTTFTTCSSIGPSTKPSTSSSSRERAVWQTQIRGPSKAASWTTFSSFGSTRCQRRATIEKLHGRLVANRGH
jgi:hypothetical protein